MVDEPARSFPFWRVLLAGFCLILIAGALRAVIEIKDVFILAFIGVLIATIFSFPVDWMSRLISRGWAVVVTLILLFTILTGVAWLTVPIVSRQAGELIGQAPKAYLQVEKWISRAGYQGEGSPNPEGQQFAKDAREQVREEFAKLLPKTVPVALQGISILSGVLLLIILGAFLIYQPRSYFEGLMALVPRRHEPRLSEAWQRLGQGLRHWIGGILISMTIMGCLAMLGLWLAGIQGWFTLGFLTFFGTFVPYAGAIVTAIPGLIVGMAESQTRFFYVLMVYACVHLVEGYVIQPYVMKRAVSLKPGLLLFWQMLMVALFGMIGLIVATPLLVCAKVLVGYFYIERKLGKESSPA